MNILEIDCVSYATRVGYTACLELINLLTDQETGPNASLLEINLEGEDLEDMVMSMGDYVCVKGCESGERLFRWLSQQDTYEKTWDAAPEELRLALDTFVSVCSKTHTKLRCLQIEAENRRMRPAPTPAPKIEDTIFEEHGSLGELEPHAVEAMKAWADKPQSIPIAAEPSNLAEPGAMSLGETVHSGSGQADQAAKDPDLPAAPKTPAQRKTTAKAKKPSAARKSTVRAKTPARRKSAPKGKAKSK
ncbi:hypothetical protein [Labrenzia sp. DG1229]|uniref:hypothetical protein n=1 Tax=Labrenzia sp. DG1229 TaxID=681847 RepID=UPI00048A7CCB|nr:hypothetical protein [Labrenzia sp. DG1229]